jgi:hypothetical protein
MPTPTRRIGVLLVNLGTPDSPQTGDVRRYLNEFLTDARVIDMPAAVRYPLFQGRPSQPRFTSNSGMLNAARRCSITAST